MWPTGNDPVTESGLSGFLNPLSEGRMAQANALIARLETVDQQYRAAPSNIDAEQALLGAILINNDAYYRVSDFLMPEHFLEDLHRRVYEVASTLIKQGKVATPITLKTFLGDQDLGGVTVSQYLGRLAAEATTVINAEDYGRTISDLATRRNLIAIGEGMVNIAYDAPVESSPRDQIEDAERRLYALAETGRYDGGFQRFSEALTTAIDMAAAAYKREGQALRHLERARRHGPDARRPPILGPRRARRPAGDGQDVARHQHRLQHRQGLRGREAAGRHR